MPGICPETLLVAGFEFEADLVLQDSDHSRENDSGGGWSGYVTKRFNRRPILHINQARRWIVYELHHELSQIRREIVCNDDHAGRILAQLRERWPHSEIGTLTVS